MLSSLRIQLFSLHIQAELRFNARMQVRQGEHEVYVLKQEVFNLVHFQKQAIARFRLVPLK